MRETDRLIAIEKKYGAANYHNPPEVILKSAKGIYVKDIEGKKYADFLSGYGAVNQGHNHPEIMKAIRDYQQEDADGFSGISLGPRAFYTEPMPAFLQKVAEVTGKEKVLPMNSGAEAVETAIKIARKWAYTARENKIPDGQAEIITCESNFHGRTTTIVGFSTEEQNKKNFGPFSRGFKTIPYGDASALEEAITPNTAAFLVELIQGEGGVIVPPDGYLDKAYEICKKNDVLFIADEVQTGLGRTGDLFAFQHEQKLKPDILVLGKALSGGFMPISAVVADAKIMDVIQPGDHGSTFGGNPLGSVIGKRAIEVVVEEEMPQNAKVVGEYFREQLRAMNSSKVEEVRGRGQMTGVAIDGSAQEVCLALVKNGILAKAAHGAIRFSPPLPMTKAQIDEALPRIEKALS